MDSPEFSEEGLADNFNFIRFVNRFGGGHRTATDALAKALSSWPKERPVEVLDVGCGAGDMAPAICGWGRTHGFDIRYKGLDQNERVVKLARQKSEGTLAEYVVGDLFDLNLPEADVVMASMVLHHLSGADIQRALCHLLQKSRHALVVNDLLRSRVSYCLCHFLTRFIGKTASRHDALLSIRKGFTPDELKRYLDEACVHGVVQKKLIGRLLLVVPKS